MSDRRSKKEHSQVQTKMCDPPSKCTRAKSSPFHKAVVKYNTINAMVPGKSAGRWTSEEHQKFLDALELFGKDWKKVESHLGTRTGA